MKRITFQKSVIGISDIIIAFFKIRSDFNEQNETNLPFFCLVAPSPRPIGSEPGRQGSND